MRKIILASVIAMACTGAYAQTNHFNDALIPTGAIGQLQLQAHNMLTAYGRGDYDVSQLTLDQLVKLMAVDNLTDSDNDTGTSMGQDLIDHILGVGKP